MNFLKFFACSVLSISFLNAQQQNGVYQAQPAPVYPAMAGAQAPQQQQYVDLNQVQGMDSQTQLSVTKNNNIFLEYYAKQGDPFSASVFLNENGSLTKRDLSYDILQKSVVVFFGDWCPHCRTFLTEFSKNLTKLTSKGIHVIFVNVPSIEVLKNWQDPNMDNYNQAQSKINSFGINVSSNVHLALLGDKVTLSRAGIQGLPVILAIKNAKEYYRGVGSQILVKLKLGDPDVLKQFLEIWDNPDEVDKQEASKPSKSPKKKASSNNKKKGSKKTTRLSKKPKKSLSKVKLDSKSAEAARIATEILNRTGFEFDMNLLDTKHGGNCSCKMR